MANDTPSIRYLYRRISDPDADHFGRILLTELRHVRSQCPGKGVELTLNADSLDMLIDLLTKRKEP